MIDFVLFATESIYLVAGICLISLVVLQLSFWVGGAYSRHRADKKQLKLKLQILEQQLEAAKIDRSLAEGEAGWNGLRTFRVSKLVKETENTTSIYLTPQDRRPLPFYRPGQYLTFSMDFPNEKKPLVRCYSLSDAPNPEFYRCTIKRVDSAFGEKSSIVNEINGGETNGNTGIVSTFINDRLQEGDFVKVKAPTGQFYLDLGDDTPIILLAGGIGLTPLYSMLASVVKFQPHRRVILFNGVKNSDEYALKADVAAMASKNRNVHVVNCFSKPRESDQLGVDYDVEGRVSLELLKSTLPSNNFDYFLCGPASFMTTLFDGLKDWGVPERKIHMEAFGPSTVSSVSHQMHPAEYCEGSACKIRFAKSSIEIDFDSQLESILEAAEQVGVDISSGCRAGNCGTCEIAILKGKAKYLKETGFHPPDGHALSCVTMPDGDVEIDA